MAQPVSTLTSSTFNVSVLQCMAAMALMQVLFKSPLTDFVGDRLNNLADFSLSAFRHVVYESPIIALSTGIAFATDYALSQISPELAASSRIGLRSSLKVAQFVGATFFVKAALSRFFDGICGRPDDHPSRLRSTTIHYLCPLAITAFAAHYFKYNVKLINAAALTGGVFVLMKLLEKGLKKLINLEPVHNALNKVYGI